MQLFQDFNYFKTQGMGYFLSAGEICLCLFAFANTNSSHFKQWMFNGRMQVNEEMTQEDRRVSDVLLRMHLQQWP